MLLLDSIFSQGIVPSKWTGGVDIGTGSSQQQNTAAKLEDGSGKQER